MEMYTLENRRQKRNRRKFDTTQSDDTLGMENSCMKSPNVVPNDYNYFGGSLSSLQKMRSFEKLQDHEFNEPGYVSDSSLPSVRQSLARSRHHEREDNEGTPLLSHHHSHHLSASELERAEQSLTVDDDGNEDNVELTPARRRIKTFKKYGIQIKIAILFAIMLASVVSSYASWLTYPGTVFCLWELKKNSLTTKDYFKVV